MVAAIEISGKVEFASFNLTEEKTMAEDRNEAPVSGLEMRLRCQVLH